MIFSALILCWRLQQHFTMLVLYHTVMQLVRKLSIVPL